MTLDDLDLLPQGTPGLNIQAFDCGRKSVNDFFHNEAQDYQDELFGKTYYWVLPPSVCRFCPIMPVMPAMRRNSIAE